MSAHNKILPLALGVALASSALVTNAADVEKTSPELYGMLYLTLDLIHRESQGESSQWQLNSRNSRLGVKQDILLQNGLTAFYQVELGYEADNNDKDFYNRDTFAGLKGKYGQVRAGRFNSPLRRTEGKIDQFNHLLVGDINAVLSGQVKTSNIIEYRTPKFSNTEINVAFVPGEGKDLDGDGKKDHNIANGYSASVVYSDKGVYLGLGLDKNMDTGTSTDIIRKNNDNKKFVSDRIQLAGQYSFGQATVGAILQHAKDSEESKFKENAGVISTSYLINDFKLKAQYGLNKGSETKNERSYYAVGVDYIMDKNSFLTLDYALLNIEETVNNVKTDKDDKALTIGYQLKF